MDSSPELELFVQFVFVSYIADRIYQDGETKHQEISLSSFYFKESFKA